MFLTGFCKCLQFEFLFVCCYLSVLPVLLTNNYVKWELACVPACLSIYLSIYLSIRFVRKSLLNIFFHQQFLFYFEFLWFLIRPFYGMVFSKGHYSNINCVHVPSGLGQTQATFDIAMGQVHTCKYKQIDIHVLYKLTS